jgi:APA family basic amino acid/polyamine antiporter
VGGERTLARDLGPWAAASIVVGTIIGTGVFLKTSVMARGGGSATWVLAAWGVAGALSFTGALTYAELGARFPRAGGEYVYLREGYGRGLGFLYVWIRFWIGTPGSIAAYAVGTAMFLADTLPVSPKLVAVVLIAVFSGVNCLRVRSSGGVQTVLTVLKVAMIVALAAGALLFARGGSWARVVDPGGGFPGWSSFGAMVVAALWAYDGWNNLPMAAGEVRDPGRNLPRALVGGALAVLVIYAVVNVGYFYALPLADVAQPGSTSVAQRAATQFLGGTAQLALTAAMAISALSAMNGAILSGARVPYAAARDGLAPPVLAYISAHARVPVVAVLVQGAVACAYAVVGGFDQLTDAVVFASWLFYALNAGTVLLLRRRATDATLAFRVPGYPVVPLVFITLAVLLLGNTLWADPATSALGLGVGALGAIVYVAFVRPGRA